jgi:hypothetical protein
MAAGFDAYLPKPVDMPTLASVIVDVSSEGDGAAAAAGDSTELRWHAPIPRSGR